MTPNNTPVPVFFPCKFVDTKVTLLGNDHKVTLGIRFMDLPFLLYKIYDDESLITAQYGGNYYLTFFDSLNFNYKCSCGYSHPSTWLIHYLKSKFGVPIISFPPNVDVRKTLLTKADILELADMFMNFFEVMGSEKRFTFPQMLNMWAQEEFNELTLKYQMFDIIKNFYMKQMKSDKLRTYKVNRFSVDNE